MGDERNPRGYVAELARDGVVAVEDVLDPDRVSDLRAAAEDLLETVGDGSGPADDAVTVDGDPDGPGVTAVRNAHLASSPLDDLRDAFFPEAVVNGFVEEFYTADDLTLRVGTGPTDPEPYRAVGEDAFVAVFYLTDATDVADGPYACIHGSHRESTLKRSAGSVVGALTGMGTGDATFFDETDGTAHTGPAGTLLVAHGRTYQRFLPVAEGRRSVSAVVRFTESPESQRPKYGDPDTGARRRR